MDLDINVSDGITLAESRDVDVYNYLGVYFDDWWVSDGPRGSLMFADVRGKVFCGWELSTEQIYSAGEKSIKLYACGQYSLDYGCDAGSVTITAKAYAPTYGSLRMAVYDPDTGERMGADTTASHGEWEELSVTFTAEKKVYIVRFTHLGLTATAEGVHQYGFIGHIG